MNIKKIGSELKSIAILLLIIFAIKSSFIANYTVPTESMQHTIEPGDKLIVNKMAYDLRVPFTSVVLVKFDDPKRGDVVVFDPPYETDQTYIKRVIALPGDILEVRGGFPFINGTAISNDLKGPDSVHTLLSKGGIYKEIIGDKEYEVQRKLPINPQSGKWRVPKGHYFVMGDNRDRSGDSRAWGFVPRENILGKAKVIYFSYEWPTTFRTERIGLTF